MKKIHCNIISGDFLTIEHVDKDVKKEDDDNFVDVQFHGEDLPSSVGLTLSLQSTKELIKELQKLVDENNG